MSLTNDAFTWDGHSTRKQFWLTQLAFAGISFGVAFVAALTVPGYLEVPFPESHPIDNAVTLILLYPMITIFKRRLNDAGWSGWWMLFPLLNWIIAGFFKTKEENNKYRNTKEN